MTRKIGKMENRQPVTVQRPDHAVSRKQIDPDALKVLYRLYRHGFKGYLVGGAVRDILLGKSPKDFDVVTDARPGQIKKLFANCFLIGRRFRLAHIRFRGGKIIEVATFRMDPDDTEMTESEGHEHNNTFGTPASDAFRRDITINGLFYDISNFSIIDYVGGLKDIERERVCVIGDPKERYTEDPVRMWRVLRHAARLNFSIEETTSAAVYSHAQLLKQCSGARLFEELNKDLNSGFSSPVFLLFHKFGVLNCLFGKMGEFLEESNDALARLLTLLQSADLLAGNHKGLSPEVKYTMLFWPWSEHLLACEGSRGQDMVKLLNEAFLELDMSIVIPKSLRANIIQTACILDRMYAAMASSRMRWSLKKRARYLDASIVFSIIEKGCVLPARDPFEQIFREKHPSAPGRYRKRRFRKKNRTAGNG